MELLNELPSISLSDCKKCGATPREFGACNADEDGTVTDCDKCEERKQ